MNMTHVKMYAFVVLPVLLCALKASAQEASVNFPPGSSPAAVKGHVNPLSSSECRLRVSAGQRVSLHLTSTSRKKLVRFTLRRDRFRDDGMAGARGVTEWEGVLREGGDYWISIAALPDAGEEDFTLVISAPAEAQTSEAAVPPESVPHVGNIPDRGARPQDFIPRGWKTYARADGDLNGDGRPDQVLQLVPANTSEEGLASEAAPEAQSLLILLADGDGWKRAGVANRLLALEASQYSLELKIRKDGVLVVGQSYGMSDVTDIKHLFRYDAQTGRFLLIGRDTYNYTRPLSGDTVKVSDNYLTGVRVTTTGHFRGGVVGNETTRREQTGAKKVYFDDVDENTDR